MRVATGDVYTRHRHAGAACGRVANRVSPTGLLRVFSAACCWGQAAVAIALLGFASLLFVRLQSRAWGAREIPLTPDGEPTVALCGDEVTARCPVPRHVHWTWKNEVVPEKWREFGERCRALNPGYNFTLWTDASARSLIAREYPWALSNFDAYPYPIQRADALRYFVLHAHGGIYLDLNRGCLGPLDRLRGFPSLLEPATPVGLTNDMIVSTARHPLLSAVIRDLWWYRWHWVLPYATVMLSTGPLALSLIWAGVPDHVKEASGMYLTPRAPHHPFQLFDFSPHGGSWHSWDATLIYGGFTAVSEGRGRAFLADHALALLSGGLLLGASASLVLLNCYFAAGVTRRWCGEGVAALFRRADAGGARRVRAAGRRLPLLSTVPHRRMKAAKAEDGSDGTVLTTLSPSAAAIDAGAAGVPSDGDASRFRRLQTHRGSGV